MKTKNIILISIGAIVLGFIVWATGILWMPHCLYSIVYLDDAARASWVHENQANDNNKAKQGSSENRDHDGPGFTPQN